MKAGIRSITSTNMRHALLRVTRRRLVYGEPGRADERVMLELRRRFKGEVVALSEHLDRDLVGRWGYDQLD